MQRAQYDAALAKEVRVARHIERVGVQFDHGIHTGTALVERDDALDVLLSQLDRGELAGRHLCLKLGYRSFVVLRWNVLRSIICCRERKRQQQCNKERANGWDDHLVPPVWGLNRGVMCGNRATPDSLLSRSSDGFFLAEIREDLDHHERDI